VSAYAELEREAERPKAIRDHSARWEKLQPLGTVNGDLQQRVQRFSERKRISPQALLMLEPRLRVGTGGKVEIAFASRAPSGAVTAITSATLSGQTRSEVGTGVGTARAFPAPLAHLTRHFKRFPHSRKGRNAPGRWVEGRGPPTPPGELEPF
jgi:hypothetical protein